MVVVNISVRDQYSLANKLEKKIKEIMFITPCVRMVNAHESIKFNVDKDRNLFLFRLKHKILENCQSGLQPWSYLY